MLYNISRKADGWNIWFGHIAVISRAFLGALASGFTSSVIPATSFLLDGFALFEQLGLAFDFVGYYPLDATEGVEIFNFGLGTELVTTFWGNTNINIKAHVAIIKIAKSDASISHHSPKFLSVIARVLGAMDIWHRNNFNQWGTSTVEINQAIATLVCGLTSIFFEVSMLNAYLSTIGQSNVACTDDGVKELGNLIAFGQIWIIVVLAIKTTLEVDFSVEG